MGDGGQQVSGPWPHAGDCRGLSRLFEHGSSRRWVVCHLVGYRGVMIPLSGVDVPEAIMMTFFN